MARIKVLTSPYKFKERILLYGVGGVGKSDAVCSIMRRCPDAHFWIIDNDLSYSYERAFETDYTDVRDRGNYTLYEIEPDWESSVETLKEIVGERGKVGKANPETDWLVYDSVSTAWQWVQNYASDMVHGVDVADFMLKVRQQNKEDVGQFQKALNEGMSWPVINKMYQRDFNDYLRRWRGHFVLTAETDAVKTKGNWSDDKETQDLFAVYGVKPKGQKGLHHNSATTILMTKTRVGEYRITTVKNRNRGEYENYVLGDHGFADDYLEEIAGWVSEMRSE